MTQTARESHTFVPLILKPRGRVGRLRVGMPTPDPTLLKGLARACYWQSLLDEGQVSSQAEIARRETMDATDVTRWMRSCRTPAGRATTGLADLALAQAPPPAGRLGGTGVPLQP